MIKGFEKITSELSQEEIDLVPTIVKGLSNKLGKDNANVAMKGPMELMNVLTFCGTLKTSNGLTAVKHNHQEIKEGKLISKTDDGSDNPKLWKFTFRAFDDRGGGLITSFNSSRIGYDTEEI